MSSDPESDPPNGGTDLPETPETAAASDDAFVAPTSPDLDTEEAEQETAFAASTYGADLNALKGEIEALLARTCATCDAEGAAVQGTIEESNIVGVGFTSPDADSLVAGASGLPGEPALAVFTVERASDDAIRAEVARAAGTRAVTTVPTLQVPVGMVDAQPHRFRIRPAPGGVSVGHFRVTAGTLGCLVRGNRPPRDRRLMVLSNNHVLANSNDARLGDCISQPGNADGGRCPADQIAILERFVPIRFGGPANFVDCATGWAWPDRVRRELIYLSGGNRRFFRIGAAPINPAVGMLVGKTGRTTQLTQGRIIAVNVTVNVNFGGGRVAQFRDQIAVRGLSGTFSAGGDSGSVIWQWAPGLRPVGLLFAGGGGVTFGNRFSRVLGALDVRVYN